MKTNYKKRVLQQIEWLNDDAWFKPYYMKGRYSVENDGNSYAIYFHHFEKGPRKLSDYFDRWEYLYTFLEGYLNAIYVIRSEQAVLAQLRSLQTQLAKALDRIPL
jgi:hypothetical protein